jgi:hypothetical protein
MSRKKNVDDFVNKYVLELGFGGGAFSAIGVDPDPTSIGIIFIKTLNNIFPNGYAPNFIIFLTVISIISSVITYIIAYQMGKKLGLLCIFLAWLGGFMIIKYSMNQSIMYLGIILVFVGIFLGQKVVKPGSKSKAHRNNMR